MHCYIHVELGNPAQHPLLCRLMEKLEFPSLAGKEPRQTGIFLGKTSDGPPEEIIPLLSTLAWAEGIDVRRMSVMRFASRTYTGFPPKGEVLFKLLALHAKARKQTATRAARSRIPKQAGKSRVSGRAGKVPSKTRPQQKRV